MNGRSLYGIMTNWQILQPRSALEKPNNLSRKSMKLKNTEQTSSISDI